MNHHLFTSSLLMGMLFLLLSCDSIGGGNGLADKKKADIKEVIVGTWVLEDKDEGIIEGVYYEFDDYIGCDEYHLDPGAVCTTFKNGTLFIWYFAEWEFFSAYFYSTRDEVLSVSDGSDRFNSEIKTVTKDKIGLANENNLLRVKKFTKDGSVFLADAGHLAKVNDICKKTDDPGFKKFCLDHFDHDSDGRVSMEEVAAYKELSVYGDISSLKGIEYFPHLEILKVSSPITTLDVSKNVNLKELHCGSGKLTSLDVRKNTKLQYLFCSSNKLTSIDVSKNKELLLLDCSYGQLTSIDISENTKLTRLDLISNQLSSLDVSKNKELVGLDVRRNKLTTLDVSNNPVLNLLGIEYNPIKTLYLRSGQSITYLNKPDDCAVIYR